MKKQQKNMRGSVLVFTLLVLAILLSATLSSAGIVITGKNSSRATEKSALAFQIADGAAENVLKRVYKENDSTLNQLASNLYHSGNAPTCQTGGVINGTLPGASGVYSVAFFDNDGAPLLCSGSGYNTYSEWRTKLVRIVASGSYGGATRAIDVTVKPPTCADSTVDDADGNTYDIIAIGDQCWLQQNLRVGTQIGSGSSQTNDGTIQKYCFNDAAGNCSSGTNPDGGLYVWNEAMKYDSSDPQGICPDGFHIPTDTEWYTLEHYIDPTISDPPTNGGSGLRGLDAGTRMKVGGVSGFEANMTGYWDAVFSSKINTRFWSSSENGGGAWGRDLQSSSAQVSRAGYFKGMALSVRCLKD